MGRNKKNGGMNMRTNNTKHSLFDCIKQILRMKYLVLYIGILHMLISQIGLDIGLFSSINLKIEGVRRFILAKLHLFNAISTKICMI